MLKKERTKMEILNAAKLLIHSSGYESITVRSLAEKTGYSYTNMYYYFTDLKALLWRLRSYMIEEMINDLTNQEKAHEDAVEGLILVLMSYTTYYFDHYNAFRFFYFYPFTKPDNDTTYESLNIRLNIMWDVVFKKLLDQKIIHAEQIEVIVNTLLYSIHGMILLNFSHETTINLDTTEKQLIDIVYRILNIDKKERVYNYENSSDF